MSEIPERIEREMYEIRTRMTPDVRDLRQHADPRIVGKQVQEDVKDRVRQTATGFWTSLQTSAKQQLDLAREAGEKRDPSALGDAVKSDPRPMALLAVGLTVTLLTVRKLAGR